MTIRRALGGIGFSGIFLGILVCGAQAQEDERPVGWIRSADKRATLIARGTRTALTAQSGDFLFSSDKLDSGPGAVTFYYCPERNSNENASYTLKGTLELQATGALTPRASTLSSIQTAKPCLLPFLERQPDVTTIPPPGKLGVQPFSAHQLAASIARLSVDQRQPLTALLGQLDDPQIRLAAAVLLEEAGLLDEAAREYFQLAELWSEQPRLLKHIQHLLEAPVHTRMLNEPAQDIIQTKTLTGKVYALVVGISHYEQHPLVRDLEYASLDAGLIAKYLRSRRGGATEVLLLQDDQAKAGAIRNYFLDLKQKARRQDTVWLFVAAHGAMLQPGNIPSIITHRADPQHVGLNSFPLQEAQRWMLGEAAPFGRAMVFLDVCHSGYFAEFRTGAGAPPNDYFAILATNPGPRAVAYENKIFKVEPGGDPGHGVFTYFLLRGLNTDEARAPGDPYIRAARLSAYVQQNVQQATNFHQSPTALLGTNLAEVIADLNEPGIPIEQISLDQLRIGDQDLQAGRRGKTKLPASKHSGPAKSTNAESQTDVQTMIDLEDRGEQVLLDYLKGEEVPQTSDQFYKGERIFDAALQLQPGSPYLSARASFCHGRFLIFKKNYADALDALERSIRLEPRAAYAYNALGIAYLERAEYAAAEMAFEDAIDRAPLWAYPRHNLALTHWQQGRYDQAITDYRAAMERAPHYYYLPYNLGLLYATLNRRQLAEAMYRRAIDLAPARAEPLTALGELEAARGSYRQARRDLERAVGLQGQSETAMQAARHNYALLLAKRRETLDQALNYWKQNGEYLPSQFSMAQALARNGDIDRAIDQYRHILTLVPKSVASRLELIGLMHKAGRPPEAGIMVISDGLSEEPRNAVLLERLGYECLTAGRAEQALSAFQAALASTQDPSAKRRLQNVLAKLPAANTR